MSFLPILYRILEFFVNKQLTAYLTQHSILPSSQFAYRKMHSTDNTLVLAAHRRLLAKQERKYTGIVMVDMSKAFDRVKHQCLIDKLFTLGVNGRVLLWLASYLSGRSQRVKVCDALSDAVPCSRGVPQGSFLGPLLFVLYTIDISDVIPCIVVHQEFADDIILHYSDSDLETVCKTLTTPVTRLSDWLSEIGLLLNTGKTQVMLIQPWVLTGNIPVVKCKDQALTVTSTAKYLGVTIDDQLSWQQHVSSVVPKFSVAISQLWRHGRSLPIRARRLWYIGIVQARLTYASTAFFPSLALQLQSRLIKSSKSGIRAIFRLSRRESTAPPLLVSLSIPSLTHIFHYKVLFSVFRCLHDLASPLFCAYFQLTTNTGQASWDDRRIPRGKEQRLLQVPFLPGPSGRHSLTFVGNTLWNALPSDIRLHSAAFAFKLALNRINCNLLPVLVALLTCSASLHITACFLCVLDCMLTHTHTHLNYIQTL